MAKPGTGVFLKLPPPEAPSPPPAPGEPKLDIMFDQAPVAAVVQNLLVDVAGASVVIDPTVSGEITIRSHGQLTAAELPGFLKRTLKPLGLDLIDQGRNAYVLQPASKAIGAGGPRPGIDMRGGLVLMGLEHVAAAEMARLLKPLERNGASVQADSAREVLIITGPPGDVQVLVSTAQTLDVDWLQGMSYGIVTLEYADPDVTIDELKRLFGGERGPIGTMVEFLPLRSRRAILILAKRPERLNQARNWIEQLDRPMSSMAGMQVLPLRYADASELAETVRKLIGDTSSGSGHVEAQTSAGPAGGYEPPAPPSSDSPGRTAQIAADPTHNALLVRADPAMLADIRAMAQALDTPVPQVVIEATIAEVTLNNNLRFGVQWSFTTSGDVSGALSESSTGAPVAIFPGVSIGYSDKWVQATLNTLATKTNVEVISKPVIVTLNNRTANLQIGDQVPIITQSAANVTTADPAIVNTVQYRDTGILLKVTPRIGAGDMITLEVAQEASQVSPNKTSGIDSPTIQQRRFSSTVSVASGQMVALGGLISASRTRTKAGVPYLRDIPGLGELAGRRDDTVQRTELLVFLRPRIVRTPEDATLVRDDLDQRLQRLRASKFIRDVEGAH